MPLFAVKLYFTSPLHIGKPGLGMEESEKILHSDTLYSIIYQTWLKMYGKICELPITITSAFPFVDRTYFLPKPGLKPPGFEKDEIRGNFAKSVKSSGFISCSIFEKWIQNEEVDYRQLIKETETLNKNIKTNVRSRVALNRITEESNLYFVGETVFNKELSGLYFAVECQHDIFQKLKQLFEFLREEGIGGERSLGYGRFNAEYEENFKIPNVADGEKYITLSLYSPKDQEELDNSAISYQLLRRSGWSIIGEKHLLQKEVLMFSEGSVFHKPVKGRIVNVAPDGQKQAIYKCGKAFLVKAR